MTTVNGLPAHVLLVHVVVVLVPLTSLVLLLVAFWPAARPRLAVAGAVLGVVTLVSVPLTTDAGEWLERRLPSTPLLRAHTELGDYLLPWAVGLAVVGLALGAREVLAARRAGTAGRGDGPGAAVATHARRPSADAPGGRVVTWSWPCSSSWSPSARSPRPTGSATRAPRRRGSASSARRPSPAHRTRPGRAETPGPTGEARATAPSSTMGAPDGPVLMRPPSPVDGTGLGAFLAFLSSTRGLAFADHRELWRWSVAEPEAFWGAVWEHYRVPGSYDRVLGSAQMPGAQWFPGARLNYAAHMLGTDEDTDRTAIIARSQTREPRELTFGELREQVGRARAGLVRLGVGQGDRVVGYLPHVPETIVVFLAAASLGAIWAACAPEFGARSVVDRLGQLEPTVLLAVASYRYGDKDIDQRDELATIRAGLPSVRHVVGLDYGPHAVPDAMTWDELLAEPGPVDVVEVPFDHPLYVLFSSGTTGLPKAIVHGHGGILLEHLRLFGLHFDIRPGERTLWFTTTAWAMWNITISVLLHRGAIVLLDGNPLWPDLEAQWRLAAETGVALLGASPGYLMACRREGVVPPRWPQLRQLGTTGAPAARRRPSTGSTSTSART